MSLIECLWTRCAAPGHEHCHVSLSYSWPECFFCYRSVLPKKKEATGAAR